MDKATQAAWLEELLRVVEGDGVPSRLRLRSLVGPQPNLDTQADPRAAQQLCAWEQLLTVGLQLLQDGGRLREDADPAALATAVIAAFRGGLLLAEVSRDAAPMHAALDMARSHLTAYMQGPSEQ